MGGLAVILEEEGLSTTQISLIRIHTERTTPPRALWVPFELGRPFGAPNDPVFQKRVLMEALSLFDADRGPVLKDFPDDAPEQTSGLDEEDMDGLVCAIALPKLPDPSAPTSELGRSIIKEIASLAPWYDLAVRTRGRTTVGPSGLSIDTAAKHLASFLEDQTTSPPRDDMPAGRVLKLAYEDLKAYYSEAITVQPGFGTSTRVEDWLFNETALGKALWRLRTICRESDDEYYQYLGRNSIVSDRQVESSGS